MAEITLTEKGRELEVGYGKQNYINRFPKSKTPKFKNHPHLSLLPRQGEEIERNSLPSRERKKRMGTE